MARLNEATLPQTLVILGLFLVIAHSVAVLGQTTVATYHYDNNRTGWNKSETVLTPANVASASFGLVLQPIPLDDQVDAQPLVVPGVSITAGSHQGIHDVVYVATENNTVYAIDVHTGVVLLSPNFGVPVPQSILPGQCGNNGPNVGITSTPVIDPVSKTLYVMAFTNDGPTYRLHALNLGNLTDRVTPRVVTATHSLSPSGTTTFNAIYERQRPALLLANGTIYAGFGSFCDEGANVSRGWLLGWTALNSTGQGSLPALPANQLLDYQASDADSFFLSSIWMSGYGPAVDDSGNILFVTGNSRGYAYTGSTDIQESVVKVSSNLASVVDLFTPDTMESLDDNDYDFGSGGVLVLPDQPGSVPHVAVAAGKDGNMYLMNEDHLGGFFSNMNDVLGTYSIGNCWCGESYYVDPVDGLGRVVSSGGTGSPVDGPASANTLEVWKVQTSPTVALTEVASAALGASAQGPGFFTTISSNGNSNPIIWAVSRPSSSWETYLWAFNPDAGGSTLTPLYGPTPCSADCWWSPGWWPNLGGNANLVPVVANGEVFVASNKQLQVFGINPATLNVTFLPAHAEFVLTPSQGYGNYQPGHVTVTNTSAYTMTLTYSGTNGFSAIGRPVGHGYQCFGQPLGAGASCVITAQYDATASGVFSGSLTVTGKLESPGSGSYSATINFTANVLQP